MTTRIRDAIPAARACAAVWVALAAAGCGGDTDFDNARHADTPIAWDDYLRAHPDGAHAREARERRNALLEEGEWQRAHAADSVDAYQRYLHGYPQGAHQHDALVAIANLNLVATPSGEAPVDAPAEAPPAKPAAGTITRVPAATASRPAAPPVVAAAPAPARARKPVAHEARPDAAPAAGTGSAGTVRVQLGAFGDGAASAERAWRALAARYADLSSRTPLITAARTADGRTIHRLQVEGFDRSAAADLCARLAARRDPCMVVPPSPGSGPPTK